MSKIDLTNVHPAAVTIGVLGGLIGAVSALMLAIVWSGLVTGVMLSVLWGWFIVPIFGLPALSIIQAWGVAIVFRSLQGIDLGQNPEQKWSSVFAKAFIGKPLVAVLILGIAWVGKSWM